MRDFAAMFFTTALLQSTQYATQGWAACLADANSFILLYGKSRSFNTCTVKEALFLGICSSG